MANEADKQGPGRRGSVGVTRSSQSTERAKPRSRTAKNTRIEMPNAEYQRVKTVYPEE